MKLGQFWDIAKKSVNAWMDDDASSMGAAIAFYTVFSIAPLLVIVIAVAGVVWVARRCREKSSGRLPM